MRTCHDPVRYPESDTAGGQTQRWRCGKAAKRSLGIRGALFLETHRLCLGRKPDAHTLVLGAKGDTVTGFNLPDLRRSPQFVRTWLRHLQRSHGDCQGRAWDRRGRFFEGQGGTLQRRSGNKGYTNQQQGGRQDKGNRTCER